MYKPADPSLGLMRADIGAASLSLFGDPYELDPFDRYLQGVWSTWYYRRHFFLVWTQYPPPWWVWLSLRQEGNYSLLRVILTLLGGV